jgi:4-amino-4-deoxy-L-arabinose transferase-like glycosyltransferase
MAEARRLPLSGLRADLLGLLVVVLGNPVLREVGVAVRRYDLPDVSAYATLARVMAGEGLLYLKSWGFVDQAVILPPLLPALMAFAGVFTDDPLRAGAWVSGLSALGAGAVFYALSSRLANRVVAVAVTLGIQTGYAYYDFAFTGITESLFTFVTGLTLLALLRCCERGGLRSGVALGLCCALALMARKAGAFVVGGVAIWIVVAALWDRRPLRDAVWRRGAFVVAGTLLIFGPYAVALYAQAGQHPMQPRFRMGEYVVGTDDPAVIAEIEEIQAGNVGAQYRKIRKSRRAMRKLLPDASEMYGALSPMPGAEPHEGTVLGHVLGDALAAPTAIFERLGKNLGRLRKAVGWPLFALFLATSLSPLLARMRWRIPSRRWLLPVFLWTYLLGVSIVTDLLDRYVVVLVPFVAIQCAAEVFALAALASARRIVATVATLAIVGGALALQPRNFTAVPTERLPVAKLAPYAYLRAQLPPGVPVFAAAPLDALLLGAGYRALPNAPLDRTVRYAKNTGVEWLVVTSLGHDRQQVKLYEYGWYLIPSVKRDALVAPWLEKRAQAGKARYTLYRIRDAAPGRREQ